MARDRQEILLQMMLTSLRGELTVPQTALLKDMELFEAVARSLHLSSDEEMNRLKDVLFPTLLCSAVKVRYLSFVSLHVLQLFQLINPFDAFKSIITFADSRSWKARISAKVRRQLIGS